MTNLGYTFASQQDAEAFLASIDMSKLPGTEVEKPKLLVADDDDPEYDDGRPWDVEFIFDGTLEMHPHEVGRKILSPIAKRFGGVCVGT